MRYVKYIVAALVAVFYTLMLTVDRSAGVVYSLLLVTGLVAIAKGWRPEGLGLPFAEFLRKYWVLSLAMCMPLVAVFINQVVTGHFASRPYDAQSRLALFAVVLWLMLFLPLDYLRKIQWAIVAGVVIAVVKMYILSEGGNLRYGTDFIPIIICAHMGLQMGMFAAFSISWGQDHSRLLVACKLSALCAGFYMAFLSGSRGVWVTIFVYGLIVGLSLKHIKRVYKLGVMAVFVVTVALSLTFGSSIKHRLEAAGTDLQQYSSGSDVDTSLGLRLQLWKGSWILFKEHPVVGVGIDRYQRALGDLAERKIISPFAATLPHSHNEMLFMMVRLGTLGVLALLAIYLVPLWHFARECRHDDREVRGSAAMGIALVAGFMVLGLVDVVFLWWECYPFYAIGIAYCMACIIRRKKELGEPLVGVLPRGAAA